MPDPVQADHATTRQATNDSRPDRSGWGVDDDTRRRRRLCPGRRRGPRRPRDDRLWARDRVARAEPVRPRRPLALRVAGLVGLKLVAVSWVAIIWHVLGRRYGVAAMGGLALPQGIAVTLNVPTIPQRRQTSSKASDGSAFPFAADSSDRTPSASDSTVPSTCRGYTSSNCPSS